MEDPVLIYINKVFRSFRIYINMGNQLEEKENGIEINNEIFIRLKISAGVRLSYRYFNLIL
jgi:hypothetical protein